MKSHEGPRGASGGSKRRCELRRGQLDYLSGTEQDNENGSADPTRLDRIEKIVEVLTNTQVDMQQDVKILLRSQVVMGDDFEKLKRRTEEKFQALAEAQKELTAAQKELTQTQKHTDERMDALILTVDEIVRGRKQ